MTLSPSVPSLIDMDVPLNADLEAKLSRLAVQQGRASEALVVEAIERLVNYDEWFLREVDGGLAAADRGELVDHADVRKMIDQRFTRASEAISYARDRDYFAVLSLRGSHAATLCCSAVSFFLNIIAAAMIAIPIRLSTNGKATELRK